jgi:hypothetical protein
MDFDLPSLQYLFKVVQKQTLAVYRLQEVIMDLSELTNELPVNLQKFEEKIKILEEITKYLSKYNEYEI